MQIPILNGIFTNESSDFRTSYPRNLVPVPSKNGISEGYLRPADGVKTFGNGPGNDRGGINWNDYCFRVMGTKLIRVFEDGTHLVLGDVGGSGHVTLDYSFDYLGISSSGNFYLYDGGSNLTQVTDPDLGTVIDFIWIDGYFLTTDGEFLIVTDLSDPFSVNPIKYASSEINPDKVKGILKIRNEAYAVNRYTIEIFQNVGGSGFPFQVVDGAQIEKGAVGTYAACVFMEMVAFVGNGENEAIAIYLGTTGRTIKISTREIDIILAGYSTSVIENIVCEVKVDRGHQHLWIRLPDQTLVYDGTGSQAVGEAVWFTLTSSLVGKGELRMKNLVWCYDKWICGDTHGGDIGVLVDDASDHYGQEIGWDFGTMIIYNEGRGIIIHELELVCLSGRVVIDADPTIWTQYSLDGETWSQEKPRSAGKQGQRNKRISWLKEGKMANWRIQRFRGTSLSHLSIARLQATIEPLYV